MSEKSVWVVGAKNTNADKSINWDEKFPNLSDPDVLIFNLTSLSSSVLSILDDEKYSSLKSIVIDKFRNGGTVIFITEGAFYSPKPLRANYFLCPIGVYTEDVEEGKIIKITDRDNNPFTEYLDQIDGFSFYLKTLDTNSLQNRLGTVIVSQVSEMTERRVTDNAGHIISCSYEILSIVGQNGKMMGRALDSGEIIFLPPPKKITIVDGINKILEVYGKSGLQKEPLPQWINQVKLYGIKELNEKITQLNTNRAELEEEISKKLKEKQVVENFYSLLYAQNKQLENIVRDSFKLLGFDEIKRIRNENDEDWVIDLKSIKGIDHGIIEVKGRNEKTKQFDIVQCNKWVDDYHQMEPPKNTKGIFISNQFRLESYPASKEKRTKFEPNELQYAKSREICIIPTYVLFEAVNKALDGKQKSRKEIEKLLYETNGVLSKL